MCFHLHLLHLLVYASNNLFVKTLSLQKIIKPRNFNKPNAQYAIIYELMSLLIHDVLSHSRFALHHISVCTGYNHLLQKNVCVCCRQRLNCGPLAGPLLCQGSK